MTTIVVHHVQGIIYIDASSVSLLPANIRESAGMKFPINLSLLEMFRSHLSIFNRDPIIFKLPENEKWMQLEYVMGVLWDMGSKYYRRYNAIPVMVIDSVDAVAKSDKKMFEVLIRQARLLANARKFSVVLVSCEGNVL